MHRRSRRLFTLVLCAAFLSVTAVTLAATILFGLVALPCLAVWTLIGVGTARILKTRRALRLFNLAMAGLLVASLVPALMG